MSLVILRFFVEIRLRVNQRKIGNQIYLNLGKFNFINLFIYYSINART